MSNAETVWVGVIGAGNIFWQQHLPSLKQMEGIELYAVCDRSLENACRAATALGIRHVETDWRKMMERSDLDAVMICTWPDSHAEMCIVALEAGLHVMCERPMARNLSEAKKMLTVAGQHPEQVSVLVPTHMRLPYDMYVRKVLRSGELGEITAVDLLSSSRDHVQCHEVNWDEEAAITGSQVIGVTVFAELLNAWVGAYDSLSAVTTTPVATKRNAEQQKVNIEIAQVVMVAGQLENGAAAVEYHSTIVADTRTPRDLLTIHGLEGTLRCDFDAGTLHKAKRDHGLEVIDIPLTERQEWRAEADFFAAVRAA